MITINSVHELGPLWARPLIRTELTDNTGHFLISAGTLHFAPTELKSREVKKLSDLAKISAQLR